MQETMQQQRRRSASAINWLAVLRMLGWLLLIEAAFMLIPLVTAFCYGGEDWVAFAVGAGLTAGTGLFAITAIPMPQYRTMGRREGFLLTAVVWIVFSGFGMIPLLISEVPLSVSEAFFEAVSGFTTTGATVIERVSTLSHAVLMWRAVMQWVGGLGIVLFTLAVIPRFNHTGGMMMFNAEVTGITHDKLRPRISQTAAGLWMVYLALTVLMTLLLLAGPMDIFDSLCHAFSTVSTGGYSTADDGLAHWDSSLYVKVVVTFFMFAGGVNFALVFAAATAGNLSGVKALWTNDVFRLYVKAVLASALCFALCVIVWSTVTDWRLITVEPLFQAVSAITSTGYVVEDFGTWGPASVMLLMALMLTGACAGSTSGGAKLDRIRCAGLYVRGQLKKAVNPGVVYAVRQQGRVVPPDTLGKIMAFLALYAAVIFLSSALLCAMGVPQADAVFSSFSCIGNVGLNATITGYGGGYDLIPDAGKWVLSVVMIVGRLELFTVFVLFTGAFWRK